MNRGSTHEAGRPTGGWRWGHAALTAAVLAAPPALAQELHVYGVAEFGGSGECGSSSSTHTVHTKTVDRFADHFDDLEDDGLWSDVRRRNNKSARGSYWADPSKDAAGDDTAAAYGADEADVVLIHTHGYHDSYTRSGLLFGNSSYECWIETDYDMLFNSDLEIAVVKACQSGDYNVWNSGGYRQEITDSGSNLSTWNAFHGNSSCGSHVKTYLKNYAKESDWNGVGENWIDRAYDKDWGSNNDDCPTSIVMGASSSDRDLMFEYGGWRDRKNTGSKTGSTIYYVSGCDPSDGITLP